MRALELHPLHEAGEKFHGMFRDMVLFQNCSIFFSNTGLFIQLVSSSHSFSLPPPLIPLA